MTAAKVAIRLGVVSLSTAVLLSTALDHAQASGHRDSLSDSQDPAADVSDVYVFRSWQNPDRVVLIMNVFPVQQPSDGPVFFNFADDVLYRLHVDNDMDGVARDVTYELRFRTTLRPVPGGHLPFAYVGHPNLVTPSLPGITALSGPGSEGLTVRQTYTLTEVRGRHRTQLFRGRQLIAVPANAGPATMPNYESLAALGIYADAASGIRVFAGQRAEATYGDIGAIFDTVNLRRQPPFLTETEDADEQANAFGVNRFQRANVNSIAIEVPIARLTRDGKSAEQTAAPFLGVYASTGRPRITVRGLPAEAIARLESLAAESWGIDRFVQVSRMANPTLKTLMFDIATKERFDSTLPEHDAQYQQFVKDPTFSRMLAQILGVPAAPPPRLDLLQILFKYPGQAPAGEDCGAPCADLLHLNVRVPPTPPANQHRLGALLSPDAAALPNGRRPREDVFDITLRAFGGPAFFFLRVGDGINFPQGIPGAGTSDGPGYGTVPGNRLDVTTNGIAAEFPFLPTPYAGRDEQ